MSKSLDLLNEKWNKHGITITKSKWQYVIIDDCGMRRTANTFRDAEWCCVMAYQYARSVSSQALSH